MKFLQRQLFFEKFNFAEILFPIRKMKTDCFHLGGFKKKQIFLVRGEVGVRSEILVSNQSVLNCAFCLGPVPCKASGLKAELPGELCHCS